ADEQQRAVDGALCGGIPFGYANDDIRACRFRRTAECVGRGRRDFNTILDESAEQSGERGMVWPGPKRGVARDPRLAKDGEVCPLVASLRDPLNGLVNAGVAIQVDGRRLDRREGEVLEIFRHGSLLRSNGSQRRAGLRLRAADRPQSTTIRRPGVAHTSTWGYAST